MLCITCENRQDFVVLRCEISGGGGNMFNTMVGKHNCNFNAASLVNTEKCNLDPFFNSMNNPHKQDASSLRSW